MKGWIRIYEGIYRLVDATVIDEKQINVKFMIDCKPTGSVILNDPNKVLNCITYSLNNKIVANLVNIQNKKK
jgi:hypothetical protein